MEVRYTQSLKELEVVCRLAHDIYVSEGYIQPQSDGLFKYYHLYDSLPETMILVAMEGDTIIGSISLCGNNMTGLPYEKDFPKEMELAKIESLVSEKNLGVVYRLVTLPSNRHSLKVVVALIHAAIKVINQERWHFGFIVVNPKHVSFYNHIIGVTFVTTHGCQSVEAAGSLLRMDFRYVYYKWKKLCSKRGLPFDLEMVWWPSSKLPKTFRDVCEEWWHILWGFVGALLFFPIWWGFCLVDVLVGPPSADSDGEGSYGDIPKS